MKSDNHASRFTFHIVFVMTQDLNLITEKCNPNSFGIDCKSIGAIVEVFHKEDRKALEAVERESESIVKAIEIVVNAFRHGGRLFYVGSGTSGRLGVLDASECPPTFSTDPEIVQGIIAGGDTALRRAIEGAEDYAENGAAAIVKAGVTEKDVVMGISTSGRTSYVIGALRKTHEIGTKSIFFSCNPPAKEMVELVDVCITPIVGPEIITGSTRLKAGTATKLVLNMITTISMIKIGKVYNNLMVDLQTWNAKLIDRAKRIIAEITGVDYDTAGEYLSKAGGNAKVAIVMAAKGICRKGALELLEINDGFLRKVIERELPRLP